MFKALPQKTISPAPKPGLFFLAIVPLVAKKAELPKSPAKTIINSRYTHVNFLKNIFKDEPRSIKYATALTAAIALSKGKSRNDIHVDGINRKSAQDISFTFDNHEIRWSHSAMFSHIGEALNMTDIAAERVISNLSEHKGPARAISSRRIARAMSFWLDRTVPCPRCAFNFKSVFQDDSKNQRFAKELIAAIEKAENGNMRPSETGYQKYMQISSISINQVSFIFEGKGINMSIDAIRQRITQFIKWAAGRTPRPTQAKYYLFLLSLGKSHKQALAEALGS